MFLRSISYSLGKIASPSILNKSFAKRSITFMIDIGIDHDFFKSIVIISFICFKTLSFESTLKKFFFYVIPFNTILRTFSSYFILSNYHQYLDDVKGHGFSELIQMSEEMGCDEHIHMRKVISNHEHFCMCEYINVY